MPRFSKALFYGTINVHYKVLIHNPGLRNIPFICKKKMPYKTVDSKITFLKLQINIDYKLEKRDYISLIKLDKPISTESYLKLYTIVGEHYNWLDRLFMDTSLLLEKINSPKTHIYTFSVHEEFAGYCELIVEDEYAEILYFGLAQNFIGKGFGKYLLSETIHKAWSFNPQWIQLNTCDLDHPNALGTYKSMGFKVYKTITENKRVKRTQSRL